MSFQVTPVSATPKAEEQILYCARVSNPANQDSKSTELVSYLIKHKHWSPFEMAHWVVEIKTSRAIAAQILRHRSFSFQEFSQRYAKVESPSYYQYEARRQDTKNRQNSIDDLHADDKSFFRFAQESLFREAYAMYEQALKRGIAKECARFLLPGNTATTLYMSGSVRSWIHYLQLRTDESTQKEHRDIAEAVRSEFAKTFPIIAEALGWG